MIIQLGKGSIKIKKSLIPEPLNRVYLQYVFELNTNHLTPKLYVGSQVYIGNRITADLEIPTQGAIGTVPIRLKVELVDAGGIPIRTYVGEIPCHKYCLFGDRPMNPHFERYIKELELEIERLSNEGEVI
jgi:hypothetical protein